ncbi:YHYH domain-containing protein [Variovorax sp. RT4R15]
MTFIRLAVLAFLAASLSPAFAHSGGTDRQGCHVDSQSGQRHCH